MTAGYYGMVAQLDHAIGRVLDTLDARGFADDTLVIVTTDHGEFLGEHQMIFKGPFGYDSLLRVPLLVRGPGVAAGHGRRPIRSARSTSRRRCSRAAGLDVPDWMEGRPLARPAARVRAHRERLQHRARASRCARSRRRATSCTAISKRRSASCTTSHEDPGELVNRYDDPAYASVAVRSPRAARRRHEPRRPQGTVRRAGRVAALR